MQAQTPLASKFHTGRVFDLVSRHIRLSLLLCFLETLGKITQLRSATLRASLLFESDQTSRPESCGTPHGNTQLYGCLADTPETTQKRIRSHFENTDVSTDHSVRNGVEHWIHSSQVQTKQKHTMKRFPTPLCMISLKNPSTRTPHFLLRAFG